jgi:predicted RNase H-like nuclease (RuvC/YqgF family)
MHQPLLKGESQMRKFLISAAIAASTLVAAAPAAAQWAPQPQGYGYNNQYGQVRRLQVRIDQLQRQINQFDHRNILSEREASRLRNESRNLEQRLRYSARNGLSNREAYEVDRGIQRLEIRIQREARDGNGYRGNYNNASWSDRDRDGRDDRYEDDRGYDHD